MGLLQLGLVLLGDGQALRRHRLSLQHVELHVVVGELDHRLALGHPVSRLDQHLRHLAAQRRVDIEGVLRRDLALQRGEVVEHALADRLDGHVGERHAQGADRRSLHRHGDDDGQHQRAYDPGADHHRRASPLRLGDWTIHTDGHSAFLSPKQYAAAFPAEKTS